MYKKSIFYIANLKNYFSYNQALAWCTEHAQELKSLNNSCTLIVCPDTLVLAQAQKILSPVAIGAQNCSPFEQGPYTGETSAQSLAECGISYCIVGHSEQRTLFQENSEIVAQKVVQLLTHAITPILCVSDDHARELEPVFEKLSSLNHHFKIIIAYEPLNAIGTGNRASTETIISVLSAIKKEFSQRFSNVDLLCMYGGSVTSTALHELKTLPVLDGFLIGKASTDFQELKKIVE